MARVGFLLFMEARILNKCQTFLCYSVGHFLIYWRMWFSAKIHVCRPPLLCPPNGSSIELTTFTIFRFFKSPLFPSLPPLWPSHYYHKKKKKKSPRERGKSQRTGGKDRWVLVGEGQNVPLMNELTKVFFLYVIGLNTECTESLLCCLLIFLLHAVKTRRT